MNVIGCLIAAVVGYLLGRSSKEPDTGVRKKPPPPALDPAVTPRVKSAAPKKKPAKKKGKKSEKAEKKQKNP